MRTLQYSLQGRLHDLQRKGGIMFAQLLREKPEEISLEARMTK